MIDHLTWVPFMGQAEFRSGPYGVVFDYIHAPLKSGISTRNILFGGGTGDFTLNTGSAVFLYRVLALPDQNADIGLGFRAWGLDGEIALNQLRRRLPPVTIANGLSWADPLISGRYHFDFGNGLGATASGDLGGFGVGAHFDWQLLGTIDYALRPGLDLHAGFPEPEFQLRSTAGKPQREHVRADHFGHVSLLTDERVSGMAEAAGRRQHLLCSMSISCCGRLFQIRNRD